jgi:hypothetical protein
MTPDIFFLLFLESILCAAVVVLALKLHDARRQLRDARLDLTAHLLRLREFNELTHKVEGGNLFAGLRHDGGERQTFQRRLARAIVKLTSDFRR